MNKLKEEEYHKTSSTHLSTKIDREVYKVDLPACFSKFGAGFGCRHCDIAPSCHAAYVKRHL